MTPQNDNFRYLPDNTTLRNKLIEIGFKNPSNLEIFPYSSCSPTYSFLSRLKGKDANQRYVLRLNSQYSLSQITQSKPSLIQELKVFNLLNSVKVKTPELVTNLELLETKNNNHEFYVSTFVPGVAIDKYLGNLNLEGQLEIFSKISDIYSSIHTIRQPEYSSIDRNNEFIYKDFFNYFQGLVDNFEKLIRLNFGKSLSKKYHNYIHYYGLNVLKSAEKGGYVFEPSLVLYDSSAGNMLCNKKEVYMIDYSSAAYSEKLMEFVSMFFILRNNFSLKFNDNTIWDFFLNQYQMHGGTLPDRKYILPIIKVFLVNHIVSVKIYYSNHLNPLKNQMSKKFNDLLDVLISSPEINMKQTVNHINKYFS